MNDLKRRMAIGLVLGVVLYAVLAMWGDAGELARRVQDFPAGVFAGALGLTLINYGLRYAKWEWYLRHLGIRVPPSRSATAFVAGMVMAVTPGKVGEVLKSFLLRRSDGIPVARTAPIVVAERMTDLLGMVIMAGVGVVVFEYGSVVLGVTVVGVGAAVAVLNQRQLVMWLIDWITRLPVVERFESRLVEAYESMYELVDLSVLTGTTILSTLAWSMEGVAMYWILTAVGASEVTMYMAFFVYAVSTLAGAVSFLPGGLGVTEGGMIVMLVDVTGVLEARSAATLATYLIRFATLWFGVMLGLVALVVYQRRFPDDEDGEQGV